MTSLTGAFAATNPSVTLTPDGVHFGVYPDASTGGSLAYFGADGLTLAQLTDLSYRFTYKANGEPPHYTAAPYLRIYTDGPDARPLVDDDGDGNPANDQTDVILDPSNCATAPNLDQAAGRFRSTCVTSRQATTTCTSSRGTAPRAARCTSCGARATRA